MAKQVVKNTKFNTLKAKVKKFDKKFSDATTLIHFNQYNTVNKICRKKLEMLVKKYYTLVNS